MARSDFWLCLYASRLGCGLNEIHFSEKYTGTIDIRPLLSVFKRDQFDIFITYETQFSLIPGSFRKSYENILFPQAFESQTVFLKIS